MIPDLDPIIRARVWTCRRCGGTAYPVDAAWLDDTLVLATFTQPHRGNCPGPRAWSMLIDTGADPGQGCPWAPKGNARLAREYYRQHSCRACGVLTGARYCAACRCQAQTAQGRRCVNRAGPDGYCGIHPASGDSPRQSSGREADDREGRP